MLKSILREMELAFNLCFLPSFLHSLYVTVCRICIFTCRSKGTREPLTIYLKVGKSLFLWWKKEQRIPSTNIMAHFNRITVLELKAHCLHFATLNMAAVFLNCLLKGWSCLALPICYLYESTVLWAFGNCLQYFVDTIEYDTVNSVGIEFCRTWRSLLPGENTSTVRDFCSL